MSDGYVFHCTPCGKPHAGECPPAKEDSFLGIERSIDEKLSGSYIGDGKSILEGLEALAKALASGNYNAKPSTLHQCSQNPPCICFQPDSDDEEDLQCPCGCEDSDDDLDASAFQISDVQLRDNGNGTATWSYNLKLPQPLRFIQFQYPLPKFYLDGV